MQFDCQICYLANTAPYMYSIKCSSSLAHCSSGVHKVARQSISRQRLTKMQTRVTVMILVSGLGFTLGQSCFA